jgi:hypothetical protein
MVHSRTAQDAACTTLHASTDQVMI